MGSSIRTFVAIEIAQGVRDRAARLIKELGAATSNVRWVSAQNLHLTLKFLGDVPSREVPQVIAAVGRAAATIRPFELESASAGAFPNPARPRTIWLGARSGEPEIATLHAAVEDELAKLAFRKEQRRFQPHLTLGRVRQAGADMKQLAELIVRHADFAAGTTIVDEVVVFSSQLGPQGPTHEPMGHLPLKGA